VSATTLNALIVFPQQLELHFAMFAEGYRNWAPPSWDGVPSEPLTAIEQLCHVRDIEIEGYQRRFQRTLDEDNPVLESIDTEALARDRRYADSDAGEALAAFSSARAQTLALLARVTPEQYERKATFEGYGPVTLRSLVHYLCSHDQQHLAGLQWLLGKIAASGGR
jgi:hypothetical protein